MARQGESVSGSSEFSDISTRVSILGQPRVLLERYGRAVRGYLEAMLGPEGEEVARDFTVKLLQGKFEHWTPGRGRFRDYLKAAVHHAAVDFLRRKGKEKQASGLELLSDPLSGSPSQAETWLNLYRSEVLAAAFKELKRYQEQHPGNVFHTLARLLADDADADSRQLADRLTQATGRRFTPENARKQTERSRRKLAELLLEQVRATLDGPSPAQLEQEVRTLGLMPFIEPHLPGDWPGTAGRCGAEA